jgi:chromosome segregation ATPase
MELFKQKISMEQHEAILSEKDQAIAAASEKIESLSSELTTAVADLQEAQKQLNLANEAKTAAETALAAKNAELAELTEKVKNYSSSTGIDAAGVEDKEGAEAAISFETSFDREVKALKQNLNN